MELDDPAAAARRSGRWRAARGGSRARAGTWRIVPAGVVQPLLEVHLLRVDEEVRVQIADARRPPRGGPASCTTGPSRPRGAQAVAAVALGDEAPVKEERLGKGRRQAGKPPGTGDRARRPGRRAAPRPTAAPRSPRSASSSARAAPSRISESSFSSRQNSPPRLAHEQRVVLRQPARRSRPISANVTESGLRPPPPSRRRRRCRGPGSRARCPADGCSRIDRRQLEQEVPPVGVHHAVGELHRHNPGECASKSSIRPPTRRPTTGPFAPPWRAPAPRWSWSRAGSATAPCRRAEGYGCSEVFYRQSAKRAPTAPRAAR